MLRKSTKIKGFKMIIHCIDCGKQLSKKADYYNYKRCSSCNRTYLWKINKHPMKGKKHTKKSKLKMKLSRLKYLEKHPNAQKGKNNSMYGKKNLSASKRMKTNNPAKNLELRKKWSLSRRLENNPNWKGGLSRTYYTLEFNKELKLKIRQRDNFICQKCGITEEEHSILYNRMLSIHHIDYNKQNCKETNLITLCTKCNSRVNFNRDYWKKYFVNGKMNYVY